MNSRELRFIYHMLQAAENAEDASLAQHPTQYVAHFMQMQHLLKTEFKGLTQKVRESLDD